MPENIGPLDGIRVLELGTTILVPYAGQQLGDLGADVVKIEGFDGDPSRAMAAGEHPDLSGVAMNLHRNKRSIALDLKHPDGHRIARRLIADADVLVTNLRGSALRRLGLDWGSVREENPRLVYAEAGGFASDSARAEQPAYDDTIQALAGLPHLAERVGQGVGFVPTLVADKVAGMTLVQGVLAALVRRGVTGRGQRVEAPMFDSVLSFVLVEHLALAAFPGGEAGYSRILTAHRGPHRTADGWLSVTPYTDRHWRVLFAEAGRDDLLAGPSHASHAARLRDADVVYAQLKAVLAERTSADWLEVCRRLDVPVAEVPTLDQVLADERLHQGAVSVQQHPIVGPYRSIASPLRFSDAPGRSIPSPAPLVGADARAVLADLGIDAEGCARLIAAGAVRDPDDPR